MYVAHGTFLTNGAGGGGGSTENGGGGINTKNGTLLCTSVARALIKKHFG